MKIFQIFLKKSSWLFGLEVFLKIKGFLLIPLITKYLGVVDYGVWAQLNIVIASIFPLVIMGTDSATIRFLSGANIEDQKRCFNSWLIFLTGMSIIGAILIFVLANPVSILFFNSPSGEFKELIILAIFTIITTVLFNAVKMWFRIQDQTFQYSIFLLMQGVFNLLATVIALYYGGGIYEVVFYSLLSDAFLLLAGLAIVIDHHFLKFDFAFCKRVIKYGHVFIPSAYAMWILNSSDRVFLAQYTGLNDIGIYSLAYSLGYMLIQLFVNPIWTMFPSKASELFNQGKLKELCELQFLSKRLIVFPVYGGIILFLFSGKNLISIISTTEFSVGYLIAPIISLAYLFHMLASYDLVLLGLVGAQRYDAITMVAACLVHLVFNFLLIPAYGAIGAAISTCIGYMIQFLLSSIVVKKYIKWKIDFMVHMMIILFSFVVYLLLAFINSIMFLPQLFSVMMNISVVFIAYGCLILKYKKKLLGIQEE